MCDYSLQNVKSHPAKVGEKLRTQLFNLGTRGFAFTGKCQYSGLRSSGHRACLHHSGKVLRTRAVARLEVRGAQAHHGHLSASQQGEPANAS
jgi:hypothetical protein